MTQDMSGPIAVFLSYAQIDDEGLGFVERFRDDLVRYCKADHGREVTVFYDRDSLGWGEQWRTRISDAIDGALVFLPLITLTYFQRPYCRDELFQYFSSARDRQVVDLLLPVVVLGHDHITSDSPDRAVRIIAERQQFDFRAAAVAGPGTPEWRYTMLDLASRLVAAVSAAEPRLATTPVHDRDRVGAAVRASGRRLVTVIRELTGTLTTFTPELERAAADPGTPARVLADRLTPGGLALERHGLDLESAALDLNGHLRALVDLTRATGTDAERARLRTDLAQLGTGTADLDDMATLCEQYLTLLEPLEPLSVPLRHALAPTRTGFRAIGTAVGIIKSWTAL